MRTFYTTEEWLALRQGLPCTSIGFVPTMGNLHAGHASLFQRSKDENEITVASLFVNPFQFNDKDDFHKYPRTLAEDLTQLEKLKVDYCLIPTVESIYLDDFRYMVDEARYSQSMEGEHRAGHFKGVLTVVMKLFNLVKPTVAYFGEKDYQQYQLIKDMVSAFFMDIKVQACPTVREASGLALSSRNSRLNPDDRLLAEKFAGIFQQNISCDAIITALQANGIKVDYIVDYQGRRFAAVILGAVRLIDNYAL